MSMERKVNPNRNLFFLNGFLLVCFGLCNTVLKTVSSIKRRLSLKRFL